MFEQCCRDSYEGQKEVDWEGVLSSPVAWKLNEVEEQDRESNDKGLAHFNAINASKDIDCISTEHSQHPHVHKVQYS